MRKLFTILSIILALIGLALSILPFGYIAIIPIVLSFIIGLLAFRALQKENKSTGIIKLVFAVLIISLGLSIYNALQPNEVAISDEAIEQEKLEDEKTMEELEGLEIED